MARDGGLRFIAGGGSASGSRGCGVSASVNRSFSARGSRGEVVSANTSGSRGQSTAAGQGGQSGSGHGGSVRDPRRRDGDNDGEGNGCGHGYARQGWNGRDDDVMSYDGTTMGDFIGK
jgi:hypothetical protein